MKVIPNTTKTDNLLINKIFQCSHCKTKIKFEDCDYGDIKTLYTIGFGKLEYLDCPICKETISLRKYDGTENSWEVCCLVDSEGNPEVYEDKKDTLDNNLHTDKIILLNSIISSVFDYGLDIYGDDLDMISPKDSLEIFILDLLDNKLGVDRKDYTFGFNEDGKPFLVKKNYKYLTPEEVNYIFNGRR